MPTTNQRDFLSTQEAHEKTGLSTRYLQQLLQKKHLEGFKAGSVWFIYEKSLSDFITQPRKRGPKGPHKKDLATNDQVISPDTRSNHYESRQEAKKPQRP